MDRRRATTKMQVAIAVVVDMGYFGTVSMIMSAIIAVIVGIAAIGITVTMIVKPIMGVT